MVGAGGHAKVCIELLRAMGEHVDYCVDTGDSPDSCVGVAVLKGDDNLRRLRHDGYSKAFIAIGSNQLRERLASFAVAQGYQLVNAISPQSTISPTAQLGSGIAVMAGAIVNAEATIADLVIINTGATVDHDCQIGKAVHIAPRCALAGNVIVGNRSFLGIGCKVVPEVKIGGNVTIGAGAIVIRDVPSGATVVDKSPQVIKHKLFTEEIVNRVFVAQPTLQGNERKYVLDCIDANWISSLGKYIGLFEETFAKFCGVRHAIATNNGTAALHLALVALGLKPNDEVIIPTVTYIATANAVRYCGATPVLVDVCPNTMNIDPNNVERKITPKTQGIIPVHLYGHPAQMGQINAIADRHGLWVVEDAAEAHGAEVLGRKVGGLGNCAAFSFYANKIITTGEGGMVTTNDDALAAKLRLFRGQGVDPKRRYWFPVVGYNYRMTNIQAAIGLAQMEMIDKSLSDRETLAGWYNNALASIQDKIILPKQESWAQHVYWMYNIFLRDGDDHKRDAVMRKMDEMGVETRPTFHPMHVLPPYREANAYPVADLWAGRGMNLPTHQDLTQADVQRIAHSLTQALA